MLSPARPLFRPAAVSGAWSGDDSYTVKIVFYETPFIQTLRLDFAKDQLSLESRPNVGFGSTKPTRLVSAQK